MAADTEEEAIAAASLALGVQLKSEQQKAICSFALGHGVCVAAYRVHQIICYGTLPAVFDRIRAL